MQNLYRHFDKGGGLLYVGVSLSAVNRLSQHRQSAAWFDEIATMTIEKFESRKEALEAERLAIRGEKPAHNIYHNRADTPAPERRMKEPDRSRAHLLHQVVGVKPLYNLTEAQATLLMGPSMLNRLMKSGVIGYVEVAARKFITGWQIIDYLENLQGKPAG